MQRNRPVIIAAILLGLLAIGLTISSMLGRGGSRAKPVAEATPVPHATQLVALHDIPPRSRITRNMVAEKDISGSAAQGLKVSDVEGKLAADLIVQGTPLTAPMLVDSLKRTTLANFPVPPGTRAVAVMIDPKQTIGNIIDVGDHVDVIAVHKLKYKDPVSQQEGEARSGRTIAQNLLVLATDDAIANASKPALSPPPGEVAGAGGAAGVPATPTPPPPPPPPNQPIPKMRVIVAAPPAEAERIAAAESIGDINLTIREPNEVDQAPVPEAFEYPNALLTTKAHSAPRAAAAPPPRRAEPQFNQMTPPYKLPESFPPPPAPTPIENPTAEITVIRGTEKTRVIVPQK